MSEDDQKDDPNTFLEHYVKLAKIYKVARLKARQKKQEEYETFDEFCEYAKSDDSYKVHIDPCVV